MSVIEIIGNHLDSEDPQMWDERYLFLRAGASLSSSATRVSQFLLHAGDGNINGILGAINQTRRHSFIDE